MAKDSEEVGRISLGVDLTSPRMKSQLTSMAGTAAKLGGRLFAVAGAAISAAFSAKAIVNFTKECLNLGSDLSEIQNVVDVTFGSMASKVDEFAESTITQFGLSETAAKKMMGTYGAMNKAFGFSEAQTYDMAKAVTELTADVASFYNLSTDEAAVKMKSIWTGETETLKDLGVVMTQTALDQYALNNGFGKTTANMTEQEKVMLRYQFVMSRLSDASGDFARTSGGWANQTRILTLQFEQLKATLGQGFVNLFTPILQALNSMLAKLQTVAKGFKRLTEIVSGNRSDSTGGLGALTESATEATGAIEDTGNSAVSAAKKIKRSLMGFDKITKLDNQDSGTGSSSGSSASGMGEAMSTLADESEKSMRKLTWLDEVAADLRKNIEDCVANIKDFATAFVKINFDNFKKRASDPFKNLILNANDAKNTILDIASAMNGADGVRIRDSMINIFTESFWSIRGLGATFVTDFISTVFDPIGDNSDTIKQKLSNMLKPMADIAEKIEVFVSKCWDTVYQAYEQYIKPAFDDVRDLWGNYLSSSEFSECMDSMKNSLDRIKVALDPLLSAAHQFFSVIVGSEAASAGNGIRIFCSIAVNAFKLIVNAIAKTLENFANLIEFLSNMHGNVSIAMQQVTSAIKNAFVGIPNFFQSTFASAWARVQQVFSAGGQMFAGIQDGITASFKGMMKRIVDGLNAVIREPFNKLNNTLNSIRNVRVGNLRPFAGRWGINPIKVPQIPAMAKGGIVDQPTLAMVGEAGKEAVMPLENNTEWLDKIAEKVASRIGDTTEIIRLLKLIVQLINDGGDTVLIIGDEEIARAANRGAAKIARRYGTVVTE